MLNSPTGEDKGLRYWKSISAEDVVKFLSQHHVPPTVTTANTSLMAQYIKEMADEEDELIDWTVAMAINGEGNQIEICGKPVNLTRRANIEADNEDNKYSIINDKYTLKTVLSPIHELFDLAPNQLENARKTEEEDLRRKYKPKKGSTPAGPYIRANRSPKKGLLLIYPLEVFGADYPLIGFVVSFPNSKNGHVVRFKVNTVYDRNLMKDLFDVD